MNDSINPNGYTVVYYGTSGIDAPLVCDSHGFDGTKVNGRYKAIFDTATEAIKEFERWPHSHGYGIIPTRLIVEEVPPTKPTYAVKESALYG